MDLTTCNGECVCVQDHYGARPEEEGSAKTKGLFQRVAAWRRARWRSRSTSEKHDNISEHRSPNNVYDPAASHSPGSSRDRGGIGTNEPRNEQDLVEMRRYDQADDPEWLLVDLELGSGVGDGDQKRAASLATASTSSSSSAGQELVGGRDCQLIAAGVEDATRGDDHPTNGDCHCHEGASSTARTEEVSISITRNTSTLQSQQQDASSYHRSSDSRMTSVSDEVDGPGSLSPPQHTYPCTGPTRPVGCRASNCTEERRGEREFNILFLGDSQVGKTSLSALYLSERVCPCVVSTVGATMAIRDLQLDTREGGEGGEEGEESACGHVKVKVWDTTCSERFFHRHNDAVYRQADGAIIVFSVTSHRSFRRVEYWMEVLAQYRRDQDRPDVKVALIGNKTDLAEEREVAWELGHALADKHGLSYEEVSAMDLGSYTKLEQVVQQLVSAAS